jgi:hypothetical protein
MRNLLLMLLATAAGIASAAPVKEIEGTWKYEDGHAFFQVRLERGGECLLGAGPASTSSAYMVQCTWTAHLPYIDVHWFGDDERKKVQSLRLFLSADGELMRVEGEGRRPLLRAPHEVPLPRLDLSGPAAMSALEAEDPAGYRKVTEAIDVVRKYGCRGAAMGYVNTLLDIEFSGCGGPRTDIGLRLGNRHYIIHISMP